MTTKDAHHHGVVSSTPECCMCGDHGLSQELFRCRICNTRFQHRYCSNLYPKSGVQRVCNWCLDKQGTAGARMVRSQSNAAEGEEENSRKRGRNNHGKTSSGNNSQQLPGDDAIKKQRVHSDQSMSIGRRKISEESLRRTKSEEIANTGKMKNLVCRAKVRRYKLLNEVSIR